MKNNFYIKRRRLKEFIYDNTFVFHRDDGSKLKITLHYYREENEENVGFTSNSIYIYMFLGQLRKKPEFTNIDTYLRLSRVILYTKKQLIEFLNGFGFEYVKKSNSFRR